MNWNHFILLLTGIYLGYYAINILADLYLKKKPPGEESDQEVLFFSEDAQPEIIIYDDGPEQAVNAAPASGQDSPAQEPAQAYPSPVLESTGAVTLKGLMRVAQAGLLQYTKSIPY
ncbi:hypothetical protein [Mucilaginibacter sp.]|uniref:hypothetical protein n=1 Tax=Mucilaginibacter sp. TaxID=1882438 RepID=UPI003D0B918B